MDWDIKLLGSLPTNMLHVLVEMCQIVGTVTGRDCMSGSMSRHINLRLRSPGVTSIARAPGFNKKLWIYCLPFCVKHLRNTNLRPMWLIILITRELPLCKVSPKLLWKGYKTGGTNYGLRAWNTSEYVLLCK